MHSFYMKNSLLNNYIICCHADKLLAMEPVESKYSVPIQAGAALTDMRITEINDHDGFAESISDRNSRYSEATAMYWIYRHVDSDYVGISHYRRRFKATDEELDLLLADKPDIITSVPAFLESSVRDQFCNNHYLHDWNLFISLLDREDRMLAEECFADNRLHGGNINIFKSDRYIEFCEWAFPILDEFYHSSPEKTDVYQHRDVGFIAERLSHLYVEKARRSGSRMTEIPIYQLETQDTNNTNDTDVSDSIRVYAECDRLYREHRITECGNLLGKAMKTSAKDDKRLIDLLEVLSLGIRERREQALTMNEYLPESLRNNLDTLLETYCGYKRIYRAWSSDPSPELRILLDDYLKLTHFSETVQCEVNRQIGRQN